MVYRVTSFVVAMFITFLFTGSLEISIGLTIVLETTKFIQYYLFEKKWNKWKKSKENI